MGAGGVQYTTKPAKVLYVDLCGVFFLLLGASHLLLSPPPSLLATGRPAGFAPAETLAATVWKTS